METRICNNCGEEKELILDNWTPKYGRNGKTYFSHECRKCINVKQREHYQKYTKFRRSKWNERMWVCLRDKNGAFRGSHFMNGAMFENLEAGVLPPGSIWRFNGSGKQYIVRGNELYIALHESLMPENVEKIPEDLREEQRLVEYRGSH